MAKMCRWSVFPGTCGEKATHTTQPIGQVEVRPSGLCCKHARACEKTWGSQQAIVAITEHDCLPHLMQKKVPLTLHGRY